MHNPQHDEGHRCAAEAVPQGGGSRATGGSVMTDVPRWLNSTWKGFPEAPQSGSIEDRAEHLITDHNQSTPEVKPRLFNVLALDLMMASFPEEYEPPKVVER